MLCFRSLVNSRESHHIYFDGVFYFHITLQCYSKPSGQITDKQTNNESVHSARILKSTGTKSMRVSVISAKSVPIKGIMEKHSHEKQCSSLEDSEFKKRETKKKFSVGFSYVLSFSGISLMAMRTWLLRSLPAYTTPYVPLPRIALSPFSLVS